jgi:hypothetical protein
MPSPLSKQSQVLTKVVGFLRTVLSVLMHPRTFFAEQSGRPSQNRPGAKPPSIKEYLAIAVGLSALIAPLHHALLRAGGFPEYYLQLAQRDFKDIAYDYGKATGKDFTVLDLRNLTGISWLDSPVEDMTRLGVYSIFAGLFWVFSEKRLPLVQMMRYFAYSIGACMVVETIFCLVGDTAFVLLSGAGSQGSMTSLMAIQGIGGIPRLLYLFIVPAVIFPAILGVKRSVVVKATVLSVLTWGLGGLLISEAMMRTGFIIMTPGL